MNVYASEFVPQSCRTTAWTAPRVERWRVCMLRASSTTCAAAPAPSHVNATATAQQHGATRAVASTMTWRDEGEDDGVRHDGTRAATTTAAGAMLRDALGGGGGCAREAAPCGAVAMRASVATSCGRADERGGGDAAWCGVAGATTACVPGVLVRLRVWHADAEARALHVCDAWHAVADAVRDVDGVCAVGWCVCAASLWTALRACDATPRVYAFVACDDATTRSSWTTIAVVASTRRDDDGEAAVTARVLARLCELAALREDVARPVRVDDVLQHMRHARATVMVHLDTSTDDDDAHACMRRDDDDDGATLRQATAAPDASAAEVATTRATTTSTRHAHVTVMHDACDARRSYASVQVCAATLQRVLSAPRALACRAASVPDNASCTTYVHVHVHSRRLCVHDDNDAADVATAHDDDAAATAQWQRSGEDNDARGDATAALSSCDACGEDVAPCPLQDVLRGVCDACDDACVPLRCASHACSSAAAGDVDDDVVARAWCNAAVPPSLRLPLAALTHKAAVCAMTRYATPRSASTCAHDDDDGATTMLTRATAAAAAEWFAAHDDDEAAGCGAVYVRRRAVGEAVLLGTDACGDVWCVELRTRSMYGLPRACLGRTDSALPAACVLCGVVAASHRGVHERRLVVHDVRTCRGRDVRAMPLAWRLRLLRDLGLDDEAAWPHASPLRLVVLRAHYVRAVQAHTLLPPPPAPPQRPHDASAGSDHATLGLVFVADACATSTPCDADAHTTAYVWLPPLSRTARFRVARTVAVDDDKDDAHHDDDGGSARRNGTDNAHHDATSAATTTRMRRRRMYLAVRTQRVCDDVDGDACVTYADEYADVHDDDDDARDEVCGSECAVDCLLRRARDGAHWWDVLHVHARRDDDAGSNDAQAAAAAAGCGREGRQRHALATVALRDDVDALVRDAGVSRAQLRWLVQAAAWRCVRCHCIRAAGKRVAHGRQTKDDDDDDAMTSCDADATSDDVGRSDKHDVCCCSRQRRRRRPRHRRAVYVCMSCLREAGDDDCAYCGRSVVAGMREARGGVFYCHHCWRDFATPLRAHTPHASSPRTHASHDTPAHDAVAHCASLLLQTLATHAAMRDVLGVCCTPATMHAWRRCGAACYVGVSAHDDVVQAMQRQLPPRLHAATGATSVSGAAHDAYKVVCADVFACGASWPHMLAAWQHARAFHAVSCFTQLHMAFASEQTARQFVDAVARSLVPGGVFVACLLDAHALYECSGGGSSNSNDGGVCALRATWHGSEAASPATASAATARVVPRLGSSFALTIGGNVACVREHVVPLDFLVAVAAEHGLYVVPDTYCSAAARLARDVAWTRATSADEMHYLRLLHTIAFRKEYAAQSPHRPLPACASP